MKSINRGYFIKRFRQSICRHQKSKKVQRLVTLDVQVRIQSTLST